MEIKHAVSALTALAQHSRLCLFRALVQSAPDGLSAGALSAATAVPPSSLSFHMKELVHAGLAESRQAGRQVIYSANLASMTALMAFLTENCCGGASCTPNPCCESAPESEHVHL